MALALILGGCQSSTPVKIPQASPVIATPPLTLVATPLPPGRPAEPEPTQGVYRAAEPLQWVEAVSTEPRTLDPTLSYETPGSSLLGQIYDPLITYSKHAFTAFVPALAEEVPTYENGGISSDGLTYTFKIRAGVQFHDGSLLTAGDVAYSFQRGLLQGGTSSPQWLLTEAFFGPGSDDVSVVVDALQPPYDDRERLSAYPSEQLQAVCQLVKSAIVADDLGRTVTFRLKQPWTPLLAALTGSWGSITSQAWVKKHGGWDGDCATWQKYYATSTDESLNTPLGRAALGTGPYKFDHWTQGSEIVLSANGNYWRKQPAWPGGPLGAPRLQRVVLKIVPEFSTRLAMLQAGSVDMVEVPRGEEALLQPLVGEVCDVATGQCRVTGGAGQPLRRWENLPSNSRLDVFFSFDLNPESNPYIGSGRLDGQGIPAEFFNDLHVRRAFSSCFDGEKYRQAVGQEQGQRASGLIPAGFAGLQTAGAPGAFDLEKCAAEFKASTLKSEDGRSLWETGFRMAIAYPIGNTAYQTIAQIWQQVLGQVNPKFIVAVTGISWEAYVNGLIAHQLPLFNGRWIADIADPHNWVAPYISGCFAGRQALPAEIKRVYMELAAEAAQEPDSQQRAAIYQALNRQFMEHASAVLLYESTEQLYLPRYVNEFVPNPLLPGAVNWYATAKE